MKKTVLKPAPPRKPAGRVPAPPAAVIIHEDAVTAQRAQTALHDWAHRRDPVAAEPQTKIWRLDSLQPPALRELALAEAVAADAVVVSVHGSRGLTAELRDWLAAWLERKADRPYALGIILDPHVASQGRNHPAVAHLEQVAAAAAAEVFYMPTDSTGGAHEPRQQPGDERSRYISEVIKSILRHSEARPGKGSNE